MTIIALFATIAAFALFALSTDEHHQRRLGRRPPARLRHRLRLWAWAAVALAFVSAIIARGWIYGPILWFGVLMLGAGLVFLALNLVPIARK